MLALTFDNLGEAADLERGLWPADRPLGHHPSVVEVLPRLLGELDDLGLRATFCVEGINAELYPGALCEIAARGHEIALHGWRHERWDELADEREEVLLRRGRDALAALGIAVRGFRPPGGEPGPRTRDRLAALGFGWISAARAAAASPLAEVPFAWPLVDAWYRLPSFTAHPLDAQAAADRLLAELAAPPAPALVLHPFLMTGDDFAAARRVLGRVRELGGSRPVAASTGQ
jgi:peptidoglycan/xylan/chitin deacetylase (PgdA/CDA1 family)